MADSAHVILTSCHKKTTGNFFIDDEVLASVGVKDFSKYRMDPKFSDSQLAPDFFVWEYIYIYISFLQLQNT